MRASLFHIDNDNKITEMKAAPYENEDAIQSLMESYPDVLAGDQFAGEEPPLAARRSTTFALTRMPSRRPSQHGRRSGGLTFEAAHVPRRDDRPLHRELLRGAG